MGQDDPTGSARLPFFRDDSANAYDDGPRWKNNVPRFVVLSTFCRPCITQLTVSSNFYVIFKYNYSDVTLLFECASVITGTWWIQRKPTVLVPAGVFANGRPGFFSHTYFSHPFDLLRQLCFQHLFCPIKRWMRRLIWFFFICTVSVSFAFVRDLHVILTGCSAGAGKRCGTPSVLDDAVIAMREAKLNL